MGFTEVTFLFVFLPLSIILYLAADRIFHQAKLNNALLVILSFIFYYWAQKEAVLFVVLTGLFIYLSGQMLEKREDEEPNGGRRKKLRLPIIVLIGVLVFYKYGALAASWINGMAKMTLVSIGGLIVPIGLSFMMFEAVSYLVDIYRGDARPGSLLECFTFLSLFPKIVSGPIVLWKDFQPQLNDRRSTGEQITAGIDRIIIGYAKKAILADTLGAQIALINSGMAGGGVDVPTMWLRAILYFFQLYFDFAGYSDIALGLCRIFGFSVKENFHYPYLSTSISEFWRRWHISLGAWFREYVYIPLGGNRRGNVYAHLLIVFVLTGLWHGTGLQFLIWGLFHGLLILLERAVRSQAWYQRIPGVFKWIFTMACVLFGWVLFMSKDLPAAMQAYRSMFVPMTAGPVNFTWRYYLSNRTFLFLMIAVIGQAFGLEKLKDRTRKALDSSVGTVIKRVSLLLLFVVDILYVVNATYSPFLYFQF